MPEISIIVPVYKAEPYLHRCVDSILAQTFTDFELILVDDGSPDNCGAICDEYALTDKRLKVIHQSNCGAAAARNVGIDAAEGAYIAFCDSDDIVSPMWLDRMVRLAGDKVLPIGAYCEDEKQLGTEKKLIVDPGKEYSRESYYTFNRTGLAGYLCNALYRRDIIDLHHIRLREQHAKGDYNEDLLFALKYIQYIDSIVYTGYSDYLYNTHEGSLSRGSGEYFFEKYAEKYRAWEKYINEECGGSEELIGNLSTETLYHFLTALSEQNRSIKDIKRIVFSEEVIECISKADTTRESLLVIRLIREKKALVLYVFYQLLRLKEKIKP